MVYLCIVVWLVLFKPVEAYLDPGTGSYLFQIIAASFFVIITAVMTMKDFVIGLFKRKNKNFSDDQERKDSKTEK